MIKQNIITKESIKDKLNISEKTKKVLIGGAIVAGIVGGAVVLYRFHCTKVNELATELVRVTRENARLVAENSELLAEKYDLEREIVRLTNLCFEKDEWLLELSSDALRHGSPLGAKHLADWRWYNVA